jgi:cation diffusion facilitator CzcD-associated flavoprotein CzcO
MKLRLPHRVTPGHGYLEALMEPNVTVVTSGIEKITEQGLLSNDGRLHEVDVIITATGYEASYIPRFPIIGFDGVNLQEKWAKEGAAAYLSCAVPGFPNYFRKYISQKLRIF